MKNFRLSISLIILSPTFGCQKEVESETGYQASLVEVNEVLRITSENVEENEIIANPTRITATDDGFILYDGFVVFDSGIMVLQGGKPKNRFS